MKQYLPILLMVFFSQYSSGQLASDSYETLWAKVFKLETETLTKSALELVSQIREKAKKEGNEVQQVKTLLFTAKYTLILEEDAKLKVVNDLKKTIATSKTPVSNVLESYLAHLYWQYFKQNRYLFYNRTETEEKVDASDFRTWDLTTLFKEVGLHFEHSLKDAGVLQNTRIGDFEDILEYYPSSDVYRPTLFDLLGHTALEFYTSSESSINKPLDIYKITDSELFCDAVTFSSFPLPESQGVSLQLRALKLYQALTQFHLGDDEPEALVALDLERLQFLYANALIDGKEIQYAETLSNAASQYKDHQVSALYNYEVAKVYQGQGNQYKPQKEDTHRWKLKEALELCNAVIANYPKSKGAEKCEVLRGELLHSQLQLTTERYLPSNIEAKLLVQYKNLDSLAFTAYTVSQRQLKKLRELYQQEKQLAYIQKLKPAKQWQAHLINEGDYQSHSIEVALPVLPHGQYLIFATPNTAKTEEEKSFAYSTVNVTNLSLNQRSTSTEMLFQVVDRRNGMPKKDAKLTLSYRKNYRGNVQQRSLTTNAMGFARFPFSNANFRVDDIKVVHGDEMAFFGNTYINSKSRKRQESVTYETFFFLDRSIYRPGQPVFFKGIVIERDGTRTQPVAGELVTVVLHDANDQEVAELDLETNDYGSFSGEFVIPNGGLNGQYRIEAHGASNLLDDSHYFSVEEYKRPKFETSFQPVTESYQLNDSITVTGKADSYAGSPISDAKVAYRVRRNVNYPSWFYWRRSYVYSEPQEIAFGETVTKADGTYAIDFKAVPDLSTQKEDLPVFSYTITADVTDINGETRSTSTTIRVGYHALTATIDVAPRLEQTQKEQELTISTQNLNGQPIPTKGTVSIYKLKGPDAVLRPRPWTAPDYQTWTKEAFRKRFPHEAYKDEQDPNTWKKGEQVWTAPFDTEKDTKVVLKNIKKWTPGQYIVELETLDKFGQQVTAKARTSLFKEKGKTLADNQLFDVRLDQPAYQQGDTAEVSFYTNAEDLRVTYWVEKKNTIVKRGVLHLKKGCESLQFPVLKEDLGGFSINYSYSVYNSFQAGSVSVAVPYPSTDLEITTNTFRDKIAPGTDETWSFMIKGPKGEKVTAEILASMYDASLDQFKGHSWYFNPIRKPYHYNISQANANLSFGTQRFKSFNPNTGLGAIAGPSYSKLDWFGLSFGNAYWAQQNYVNKQRTKLRDIASVKANIPEGTIQGTVYDNYGQPLPGASIVIKGTTTGATSDFDGNFSIKAKEGDVLVFHYVGFTSTSKKIDTNNFYKVHLQENSAQLDEVVVLGYGTERKLARSASASVLEAESFEANDKFDIAPAGKTAGVQPSENAPTPAQERQEEELKETNFDQVQLRKNLQETAFFFPHLSTDKDGNVSFSFTTPEALTQWKLQLLAHTKDLKQGITALTTVTQKELMVLPNPPRFLREGDRITLSTKIANLSTKDLQGSGQLQLTDALTGKSLDIRLGNQQKTQNFSVAANGNTQLSWNLMIPEGVQSVAYTIVAKAHDFSDGEQGFLPVLTNRTLVTETLPLWVRSNQTRTFTLEKLRDNTSTTLRHHKLSLEITSNPAWYAVQALPYLMEYPYECNEQTFARYYANSLASHIANSNPRIQEVFVQWRNSDALLSNLEKNQELKALMIQETPWLRDAQSESEQKKRIALLFDLNHMRTQQQASLQKLLDNQMPSGAWPWFKGGRANRHITQHIITGLGHLQKLTGTATKNTDVARMINQAVRYLDKEFIKEYKELKKYTTDLSKDHLSHSQVHYLYMRSFFTDIKTSKEVDEISAYYLGQAQKYWSKRSLYSKGLLAMVLHRNELPKTAKKVIRALRENSIVSEELGMYWKANTASWYWYQAPIETQALLIEAFAEVDADTETLDNLKIWLLKNKQTNQWKTTKATTEAVYALLLQGSDWLSVTDAVDVLIGGKPLTETQKEAVTVEAGTGYFKTSWDSAEIQPKMAEVQVTKKGNGIAWGALYWQYFEDLDRITAAETPLKLQKKLFLKTNTAAGEVLKEVSPKISLSVGDLVRVRIELRADRDMEFIHMKDMRASAFEPINVLSQYKWQGGLGYYETTKDASTNFFFDYLRKGVYVFEYDLRVNNAGDFSNGVTTIQSMYAPEFSSHSEGIRVTVGE